MDSEADEGRYGQLDASLPARTMLEIVSDERIAELELKMVKLRFEVNQYNGGVISADAALDGIHEILFGY